MITIKPVNVIHIILPYQLFTCSFNNSSIVLTHTQMQLRKRLKRHPDRTIRTEHKQFLSVISTYNKIYRDKMVLWFKVIK